MCLVRTSYFCLCILICLRVGDCFADTPDDRVDSFLADNGLMRLYEVQLFDRIRDEEDQRDRQRIAAELGSLYLQQLQQSALGSEMHHSALVKGQVLVGLVPSDALLSLRLELLGHQYREVERDAEVFELGLLDEESVAESIALLDTLTPELARIAKLSGIQISSLARSVPRKDQDRADAYENELRELRSIRSRAHFLHGWAGYTASVLEERRVGPDVFKSFGWVLGLNGDLPVLEEVDQDLLEYDHVARSMLGVAQCKVQNQDYDSARVWLGVLRKSGYTSDVVKRVVLQRLLQVSLEESDWVESLRVVREVRSGWSQGGQAGSAIGISQARMLVVKPYESLNNSSSSTGGREGAIELIRLGVAELIELGAIGHILDLQSRYGELPMVDDGFISLYIQGLSLIDRAEDSHRSDEEKYGIYLDAKQKLTQALATGGGGFVEGLTVHAGDAAIRLIEVLIEMNQHKNAYESLEEYRPLWVNDRQREAAHWAEVLIFDFAVRTKEQDFIERLSGRVHEYIERYPGTPRSELLAVQYAMSSYISAEDSVESLLIDEPENPVAHTARRKLIRLLHHSPLLVSSDNNEVYRALLGHAQWVWEHETEEYTRIQEAQDRIAVYQIISSRVLNQDPIDQGLMKQIFDEVHDLLKSEPRFDVYRQEFVYRQVEFYLSTDRVSEAQRLALSSDDWMDESIRTSAVLRIFQTVNASFSSNESVEHATRVVEFGRAILEGALVDEDSPLDANLSYIAQAAAYAAEYVFEQLGSQEMKSVATDLSIRVWEHGKPSGGGITRAALLAEDSGQIDIALACWLRLVAIVDQSNSNWYMARYQSLRLLFMTDPERAKNVLNQYRALHPDGSSQPWGAEIDALEEEYLGVRP